MRSQFVLRIRILVGIIVVVTLAILVKLYIVQIIEGDNYKRLAQEQYVRSSYGIFDRGSIYFTEKSGKLYAAASLNGGYFMAIHPSQIKDSREVYQRLQKYIELDEDTFLARANKVDDPYEEVAEHIDKETAKKIIKENITGVSLFREQWRYYPGSTTASHALGYVGYGAEGKVERGQYGLERYWDSVLNRKEDKMHVNVFAEIIANARDVLTFNEHEREGSVVTSIDPVVQLELERALYDAQEEWNAKHLGGIIINPKTGAIYALGALPTFNPNNYGDTKDIQVFRNPFVENVYEMGSIIKPIAMAIALDEGVVTAETTYNDKGYIELDTFTISNYDGKARGVVNMQEVLSQSLNVGMAYVAEEVGGVVIGRRMREFGFGEETGIDLPFEVRGLIDNLNEETVLKRKVEYATAAFGQGIALTPIATVRALGALGNGGYLTTPHFVTDLQFDAGGEAHVAPDDRVQVLKPETSEEITRMLVEVVDTALKGGTVKKERYSIAAKTGTAQIAKEGERGYYDDRYLHSFFGYFPAYDPEFLIFLYHVEPQGARYASETLTDPFMDIVDFLINYYHIPPDR